MPVYDCRRNYFMRDVMVNIKSLPTPKQVARNVHRASEKNVIFTTLSPLKARRIIIAYIAGQVRSSSGDRSAKGPQ